MRWIISNQYDRKAVQLADRHYSRQKVGSPKILQPGRKLILITSGGDALWGTSWPFPQYVNRKVLARDGSIHSYADAWICSIFRNESDYLASDLILQAVAATRAMYGHPPASGMLTMVDGNRVKSVNPGYCFKKAGFRFIGVTTKRGLTVLQLKPDDMPPAEYPAGAQLALAI